MGQTGAFSTGSPTQSPPPQNGDKDAYFTAVLRPLKALPDSFQALALSHPLRPFISTPGAPCFPPVGQASLIGPEKSTGAQKSRPLDVGLLGPLPPNRLSCPNFWIWQEVD